MDATTETTSVERTITIAASPETVWEFLVDPQKVMRWMGTDAELDPRPAGVYRNVVIPGHIARGEFVELDPPHRLVFTWGWERSGDDPPTVPSGSTTIEIDLTPERDGTSLHFVHRDLPNAESAESHAHGWDHYLSRLEIVAGGGDAGEDPWLTQPM
jgi:uncharacterized protein YndB with AHSA1/START domain